ncbi:MAG: peptide chain release factor N(5)-glutamine methyltransferase, partial [Chlamydiales bacterium]|nr:peptide chain release factor N(5)-glutamine methyltransferase [Chlamydiales bacterium]
LKRANINSYSQAAEDLLSYILHMHPMDLYLHCDQLISEEDLNKLNGMLQRRVAGEPLQYILKEISFFSCSIQVSQDALIPRQETELLVDRACSIIKEDGLQGKTVFDLCCGTGCIGISVKKRYPSLSVYASDISQPCVELARINAEANNVDIDVLVGDFLHPFKGLKADYVFCNPPYISEEEYLYLEKEVSCFEPKLALIGGEDGLFFYKKLSIELPAYLKPKAKVFLEIGKDQGKCLIGIFSSSGCKAMSCEKDLAGHDRFFFLEFE